MGYLHDAFSLEGKTALVTGPGTGIGQGIAKALAGAGADIIGTSHTSDLSETQRLVEQEGRIFTSFTLDMSKPEAIKDSAADLFENRQIDILVNNAGIIHREKAEDFSEENWQRRTECQSTQPVYSDTACWQAHAEKRSWKDY